MAPSFSLPDQNGEVVDSESLRGAWVVLYFYPRDETPGCTREACAFAAADARFAELGARVIGVSPDGVESHAAFAANHGLGFTLLADGERAVAEAFGAWRTLKRYGKERLGIQRSTFIIDPAGVVRRVWRSVRVDGHDEKVLEALGTLAGA